MFIAGRFKGQTPGRPCLALGHDPTSGNTLDEPFVDYFGVENGKIVEHEVIWDQMEMMVQLGAMPPG